MKKARTLFCSTRSQTHSPSESYARWRRLEPLGFARRQRPPCKRDADPSELKADRDGDHVTNGLGWLRMRQTKTYWHRNTARSEFRAEPQQPGPAYGACPCRNLHHCRQSCTSQHGRLFRRCSIVFGPNRMRWMAPAPPASNVPKWFHMNQREVGNHRINSDRIHNIASFLIFLGR